MNIYVGNLAHSVTEQSLRDLFEQKGQVASVKIIMDRETGQMRGFAFVDMPDSAEGQKAIDELNGYELEKRALRVNEARNEPRPRSSSGRPGYDRPYRGGGHGGGRGGFGDNRNRRGF